MHLILTTTLQCQYFCYPYCTSKKKKQKTKKQKTKNKTIKTEAQKNYVSCSRLHREVQSILFLQIFTYLFERQNRDRDRRKRKRSFTNWFTPHMATNSQVRAGTTPGIRNSIHIPPTQFQRPKLLHHLLHLHGLISNKLDQNQSSWDSNGHSDIGSCGLQVVV